MHGWVNGEDRDSAGWRGGGGGGGGGEGGGEEGGSSTSRLSVARTAPKYPRAV